MTSLRFLQYDHHVDYFLNELYAGYCRKSGAFPAPYAPRHVVVWSSLCMLNAFSRAPGIVERRSDAVKVQVQRKSPFHTDA